MTDKIEEKSEEKKGPNVFVDFHHGSLLKSFILLFEKRLGGKVYRPIGTEWADMGFWKVYDHPATIQQFLGLQQGYKPIDGTPPLNDFLRNHETAENDCYYCYDIEGKDTGEYNKAVTFKQFLTKNIDIIIATLPAHVEPFKRLRAQYAPNAKLIYQIGNAWTIDAAMAPNIMASAVMRDVPNGTHFISYHQEFDTQIFSPASKIVSEGDEVSWPAKNIFSFVNVFQNFPDFPLFQELEKVMSDWNFKSYGGQCRDGSANGARDLAYKMREARFIFHLKAGGDGYGHVIHNAAAVGRPLIVKRQYYDGKLGADLLIDGETCIAIDGLSVGAIVDKITHYSRPDLYAQLCAGAYNNFRKVCNFDEEFVQMKQFLATLV